MKRKLNNIWKSEYLRRWYYLFLMKFTPRYRKGIYSIASNGKLQYLHQEYGKYVYGNAFHIIKNSMLFDVNGLDEVHGDINPTIEHKGRL